MHRAICRIAVVFLALHLTRLAGAKDIYVSKTGDDSNPGTQQQPLFSIPKAVEAMRNAGPGTIWIGAGEYFLSAGVALGTGHGGTAEQPLEIRAAEPGTVRLSGSRIVDSLRPISAAEAKSLISDQARQHVLVADLQDQGFPPLAAMPEQHRAHGREEVIFG
ncbi:MAG: hypothetical protein JJ992_15730, partial [Planctomycetes bacterium]|nr:hypothetical protein [Planctomycetota bacterium]